jgi:GGDEF domain-containing protein
MLKLRRNLAHLDDLTGLPNRSLLYDRLGVVITHAHRQSTHVARLCLDLGHFKTVNDRFGHEFGEQVAGKVLDAVRAPFRVEGSAVTIGASVGMSVYPEDGVSCDELVGSADAAMYRHEQREMQGHERSGIR